MPATASLTMGGLPIGLAHNVKLKSDIPAYQPLKWQDIEFDPTHDAIAYRKKMEQQFAN